MARRAATKPEPDEDRDTLEGRLNYNLKVSGAGKMPIDMVFKTQAEVDEALKLLKKRKIDHIGAKLDDKEKK